jgi:hypothetical protein
MHNLYDIDTNDPAFFTEEEFGDNVGPEFEEYPTELDPQFFIQTVRCDVCSEMATDTPYNLKKGGWDLTPNAAFCLAHIF